MISDYFAFAFRGIVHKGIRSWLTMLGIVVGIATVVSLISLGQGMKDAVNSMFEATGYNLIYVIPGSGFESGPGAQAVKLTQRDIDVIEDVKGVSLAGGIISKVAKLEYRNEVKYGWVLGIPTDKRQKIVGDMQNIKLRNGRKFLPDDKYKVVAGYRVAEGKFFEKAVRTGDRIRIDDKEFTVIGDLEKIGSQQDDEQSYIPLKTAQELFNEPDNFFAVMVQVENGLEPSEVAEDVKKQLRRSRDVKEGEEDFTIQTTEQMMESFNTVLDSIQVVLIGIAAISLMVGGIGIMNTMYTSVLERTKEIGVMKAVGARNSDVLTLFLIESGVLGLAGGAVGVACGAGLSKIVEYVAQDRLLLEVMKAHISAELILGALAFSFIVGCASGVLPARQAAGMNPVEALRYE